MIGARYRSDWERAVLARRIRRWRSALVGVVALAVAVGAGVWAGRAAAPARDVQSAATRVVRAGGASLEVPRQWRTVPPGSSDLVGGPAGATTVLAVSPGSPERIIITVAPADDPSLVPRRLRDLAAAPLPEPRPTRLAGHRAWAYPALAGPEPDRALDVTVLPSSRGVLAVGCVSSIDSSAVVDCASSVTSVSFRDAAILVPGPELAFRLRLPKVLATLDTRRVRARSELRRVAAAGSRARMARRLALAHRAAADALEPLAGRVGAPLVERLSEAAAAYSAFGGAARGQSTSRYDVAARGVEAADAAVNEAVQRLARRDLAEVPSARATRVLADPAVQGSGPSLLAVLLLAAALLIAIVAALLRRRSGRFGSRRDLTAVLARSPLDRGAAVGGPADPGQRVRTSAASPRHPTPRAAPRAAGRPPAQPPPPPPPVPTSAPPDLLTDPSPDVGRWDAPPVSQLGSAPVAPSEAAPDPPETARAAWFGDEGQAADQAVVR